MANSYVEYTSLSGTTYATPDYLNINDINVKGYNGSTWTTLTISSRDASAKTITLSAAPSSYQKIRVYRSTTADPIVDFVDGALLTANHLDSAYQQGLYVAQEVSEDAGAVGSTSTTNLSLSGTTSVDNLTATGTVTLPSSTNLSVTNVTASGIVSNANPLANAKRTSVRQNIASANTQELINWTQTEGSGISTNQYTIPSTGKYFIAAHISVKSASSFVEMKLYKNYGITGQALLTRVYSELPNASGTTDWHPLTFSGIFSLTQNETIATTMEAGAVDAKVLENEYGNWSIFRIA